MINPISSVNPSFKALYKNPSTNFSEAQKKVVDDIENKVNNTSLYNYDLLVVPKDDTQVELFAISTPTYNLQTGTPESKYKKSIGLYSKTHPFNEKNVDKNTKAGIFWANWGKVITSAVAAMCVVASAVAISTKGTKLPVKDVGEKIVTVKDTLNNLGKDTLDLTKQLVK